MTKSIRLCIVDDHPVVRTGLQGMIANQPDMEIIGEMSNGREAIDQVGRLRPDVILMDLSMPEMDGVTAIAQIKARHPEIAILVLTTYESDSDLLRAIKAGATGYLLKDVPRAELFRAIRAAAEGKTVISPNMATLLVEHMRTPAASLLSPREIEVLRLVAQGASNKEIATRLYVSEATTKTHLMHIFSKLGVDDRTAAVAAAVRRGLLSL